MKTLYLTLLSCFIFFSTHGQQTITQSIEHDGLNRTYITYIPAMYDGTEAVPVVFNFHGYTSNASDQMFYGDFRSIADTAGFIVVHPEGTLLNGSSHWNVGGWTLESTVDDVGFTSAMLDELNAEFNIDLTRIYSTGMSNGGYMSFLLACQLSDRFAAVASVTGSMTPETYDACDGEHPTPILQMHGNIDGVVPYAGAQWTKSIDDVIEYWIEFNNCDETAVEKDIPDVDLNDGSTAKHFVYSHPSNGVTVEHIRIDGGRHTWPGTTANFPGTNQDFNASEEIWQFFLRYDINGLIGTSSLQELENSSFSVFPNPVKDVLTIEHTSLKDTEFDLLDSNGRILTKGILDNTKNIVDLTGFDTGIYFIRIEGKVRKIIKQ